MPPVVIAGGIAAAGAIGGAALGASAQNKANKQAAQTQNNATNAQLQLGRESMGLNKDIYNSNYDTLSPWVSRGNVAGNAYSEMLGLPVRSRDALAARFARINWRRTGSERRLRWPANVADHGDEERRGSRQLPGVDEQPDQLAVRASRRRSIRAPAPAPAPASAPPGDPIPCSCAAPPSPHRQALPARSTTSPIRRGCSSSSIRART
jgi:hypothetical protein